MNRFFVEKANIFDDNIIIDKKEDAHHGVSVLRLKKGDLIEVSDGDKGEYICKIESASKSQIDCLIVSKGKNQTEPSTQITLFQGMPKHGKMDIIIQKNIELGVAEIIPVYMARSIINDKGKSDKKADRYNSIAEGAAKQSKRGILPTVGLPIDFKAMVGQLKEFDLIIFPYESEKNLTIKDYLKANTGKSIAIIIGPEGGFSESEVERLKGEGIEPVTLGKTILRTETAGLAAVSMVFYEYEL